MADMVKFKGVRALVDFVRNMCSNSGQRGEIRYVRTTLNSMSDADRRDAENAMFLHTANSLDAGKHTEAMWNIVKAIRRNLNWIDRTLETEPVWTSNVTDMIQRTRGLAADLLGTWDQMSKRLPGDAPAYRSVPNCWMCDAFEECVDPDKCDITRFEHAD